MNFAPILEQHGIDNPELIESLSRAWEEAQSSSPMIPKSRLDEVISQRNELREKLSQLQDERTGLFNRVERLETERGESGKLQEQLKAVESRYREALAERWSAYRSLFEAKESDPRYPVISRIRDDFHLDADPAEMTAEQLEQNLEALKPYLKAGVFETTPTVDAGRPVSAPVRGQRIDLTTLFSEFGG